MLRRWSVPFVQLLQEDAQAQREIVWVYRWKQVNLHTQRLNNGIPSENGYRPRQQKLRR